MAKLCKEVPNGYSKSVDKVRATLISSASPDVLQFMEETF